MADIDVRDRADTSASDEAAIWAARRIVDADSHVNPAPDMWKEYLSEEFRSLAPVIEHDDDADYVVFEGRRKKVQLIAGLAGHDDKDFKIEGKQSDMRSGGWMPAARLADMDQDGMDVAVLFGGGPLHTSNQDLYIESFSAYNRWLADFCAYDPKRLVGIPYIPMRNVDESIGLIRELAAMGFRSVNIPAFPQAANALQVSSASGEKVTPTLGGQATALTGDFNGDLRYDNPIFDPLWATVTELDISLTIHLGARVPRFHIPDVFMADLLMSKFAMAEPIAILIFGGVFERFPKLRFCSIESGSGWLAFAANYMDRTWEKQRFWTKSVIDRPPSFYLEQNVYASFIHDRIGIETRHMTGAKNIMWSSDYPHSETTYPHSRQVINRDFAGVPEDEIREIIGGRAARVFRVDG